MLILLHAVRKEVERVVVFILASFESEADKIGLYHVQLLLKGSALVWHIACHQIIQADGGAPHVHLISVVEFAEHFGCHVLFTT